MPESAHRCAVCDSERTECFESATGARVYCRDCFHGQRTGFGDFSYSSIAMCSLGTSAERLNSQIEFFAPFVKQGARVLEIGCATGELAAAAMASLPISRYEAIELSPAREQAANRVSQIYAEPLRTLLDAGTLHDRSFDLVIISHVLEHMRDPAAEIVAIMRVLQPQGAIFIEVPNRSGNPHLPFDDNTSHYHFFSPTSLLRLLGAKGLETLATRTGIRLDDRYSDSLQVVARPYSLPDQNFKLLSDHPMLKGESRIVVWGAGSMAQEVLANFFDPERIAFFVDRSAAKQASTCLGRPVKAPEALLSEPPCTIILNSIDFAETIRADLDRTCPGHKHRVIPISKLLG